MICFGKPVGPGIGYEGAGVGYCSVGYGVHERWNLVGVILSGQWEKDVVLESKTG